MSIIWIVGIGALMYFMMIRPQRKQQKAKNEMMSNLKKGDRVVTVGGAYGIVRALKEDRVTLEVASEVYVQFTRNAIGSVLRSNEAKADAPEPATLAAAEDDDADYVIEQDED
jgi:preprotein translocase subunit YajC